MGSTRGIELITLSIKPYEQASSGSMKRSRSVSFSICSRLCPQCLMRISLSRRLVRWNSRRWIEISSAVPCIPAKGWWIMILELGSENRLPSAPAVNKTAPIDAAWPMQYVATSQETNCIVS